MATMNLYLLPFFHRKCRWISLIWTSEWHLMLLVYICCCINLMSPRDDLDQNLKIKNSDLKTKTKIVIFGLKTCLEAKNMVSRPHPWAWFRKPGFLKRPVPLIFGGFIGFFGFVGFSDFLFEQAVGKLVGWFSSPDYLKKLQIRYLLVVRSCKHKHKRNLKLLLGWQTEIELSLMSVFSTGFIQNTRWVFLGVSEPCPWGGCG